MGGSLPNLILLMAVGPLVTVGTPRTTLGPPGTLVVLTSMGLRVGGRNNYLRFQRGDQGPDREGGRAGGGVAPGQTPYYHTSHCKRALTLMSHLVALTLKEWCLSVLAVHEEN